MTEQEEGPDRVGAPTKEAVGLKTGTTFRDRNVGVRMALFALRCYQTYLSVLFAGTCRFEPTCSHYAYQAIERFGVLRGAWLGAKRLARCHPFSGKFGYDPVPDEFNANFFIAAQRDKDIVHAANNHAIDHSTIAKDGIGL